MAKGKYQRWLEPDGLILLEQWARDGLTDEQIAEKMGINVATYYRWKDAYSEICEALKKGKEVIDAEIEKALIKAALGYEYTETTVIISPDGTKRGQQVTKYAKPDTTALIFWLKNRRPNKWRDKPVTSDDDKAMEKLVSLMSKLDEEAGV